MNAVIIAAGIVLLVLAMKFIILPLARLLFRFFVLILKYLYWLMVLVFKIFLIMLKWELISLPVIIIVIVAFPNLINVQVYLITIILLTVLDIAILGRLTSKYLQKHNRLERLSNVYVLNKRSHVAHWIMCPSAWTISERNREFVEATDYELERMGYRKKKSG